MTLRNSTFHILASSRTGPQTLSDGSGKRCVVREVGVDTDGVKISGDIRVRFVGEWSVERRFGGFGQGVAVVR